MLTCNCSIVSNESSQVQRLAVNVKLFDAADKLPGAEWEVIWNVWNSTQKQGPSQVQGPVRDDTKSIG